MHLEGDGGKNRAVAHLSSKLVRDWLYWTGLLRETEGVIGEEIATNM